MPLGFICVITSSVLFGFTPNILRTVLAGGVSPFTGILWYSMVGTILNALLTAVKKESFCAPKGALLQLTGVGIVGTGCTSLLLNLAYLRIPVGFATVLHFMYPVVVAIAMSLFFHQRFGIGKMGAIIFSMTGMLLIVNAEVGTAFSGYLLALCSAATFSIYIVGMDHLSFGSLGNSARLFWINLSCSIFFIILCSARRIAILPPNPRSMLTLLLCATLVFIAYRFLVVGIARVGATSAAFTSMMEPITSLFVTQILNPETSITLLNYLGVGLILIAMLLASAHSTHGKSASER